MNTLGKDCQIRPWFLNAGSEGLCINAQESQQSTESLKSLRVSFGRVSGGVLLNAANFQQPKCCVLVTEVPRELCERTAKGSIKD